MRKLFYFIEVMVLLWGNGCPAQTLVSQEDQLPYQSDRTLLATDHTHNKPVVYFKGNVYHTFLYYPSYPLLYAYELPSMSNVNGPINYTVADMKIVDKVCYFCGKMSYYTGNWVYEMGIGWTPEKLNVGYLGRMDITNMGNALNPYVQCQLKKIDGTQRLTKLDAYRDNQGNNGIGLIGVSDYLGLSCLVTFVDFGTSYEYTTYLIDSSPETLTDIAICTKCLATTSRIQGENWSFGVRYADLDGIFLYQTVSDYAVFNKFNTSAMQDNTPLHSHSTLHASDAVIRLVSDGVSDTLLLHNPTFTGNTCLQPADTVLLNLSPMPDNDTVTTSVVVYKHKELTDWDYTFQVGGVKKMITHKCRLVQQ